MGHAYRSGYQQIVGSRVASIRHAREMIEPVMPQLRSVHAARMARALAGGVGIAGAIAMAILACADPDGGLATYALLGSSVAAVATYVLARLSLPLAKTFSLSDRLPRLTGELSRDLAELDASDPARSIEQRLSALETWSTTLPMAAASLLMPLTLHYAFISMFGDESATSFATWIRLSLVIVGHAHLTLMALAIGFGRRMKNASVDEIARMSINQEWAKVWAITVGVSALPGILLLLVPPILAAITGLAFIPFMFVLVRRRLLTERSTIALASMAASVRVASEVQDDSWAELATVEEPGTEEEAPPLARAG